ncbi:MAG: tyrosine-type recombinase/integrase [Planctomycetaceae bacterium]|nr:tyrosine-type recombinase/integrase [Planctomycetaceae bacterium]
MTEQLAAKLETEARLRATGMIDVDQERFVEQKQVPIADHLAAFAESLTDNTPKHVSLTMSRARRVVDGCGFETLAGIDAEAVQAFLRTLRKAENLGHRTYNHYLQASDAFFNWCVTTKRLLSNPLLGTERLNTEVDVRRKRRALTPDEVGKLVMAARSSGFCVQRFTGEQRARIYLLSYMTGARKNELASLTPRSFALETDPPTLTIEAKASKHRRKDVLPLHPDLVVMLRDWLKGIGPSEKLFPKLDRRKTWFMVQKDLALAGIPYDNEDGVADFHAAGRHSHITELLRNGASLPEAKELARHSDIKMTMKYVHIGIGDQARAVAHLPTPKTTSEPATGAALQPGAALHGRCISGGAGCPNLTSDGISSGNAKRLTPRVSKELGVSCRHLSSGDDLEATGRQLNFSAFACPRGTTVFDS